MPKFIDITDHRFGRLLVKHLADKDKNGGEMRWFCVCDCGNTTIVRGTSLRTGGTQSCGCLNRDISRAKIIHGAARDSGVTPEYSSWKLMWRRCTTKTAPNYKWYGGRGIVVCERWRSFAEFFADMGSKPFGYSIERINPSGNYEPDNCRWIPLSEQWKNKRPRT